MSSISLTEPLSVREFLFGSGSDTADILTQSLSENGGSNRRSEAWTACPLRPCEPSTITSPLSPTHRIVSTHRPSVDLIGNDAKVHTLVFELTVTFDLTGIAAVVRQGHLTALRGGGVCVITATLKLDDTPLELARKGSIDLRPDRCSSTRPRVNHPR